MASLIFPKPQPKAKTPKPLERNTPMKRVSDKRRAYRASDEGQAGLDHMDKVRMLPCAICYHFGYEPVGRIVAHHVFHGRYSQGKVSDFLTIPLCAAFHNQDDPSVLEYPPEYLPIHHAKAKWAARFGEDHEFLAWTLDMIERLDA